MRKPYLKQQPTPFDDFYRVRLGPSVHLLTQNTAMRAATLCGRSYAGRPVGVYSMSLSDLMSLDLCKTCRKEHARRLERKMENQS